ncbi:MAG: hypothetical protein RLO52_04735 [Sandaracinaceae bacterium]|nr:MAG: hypothetical protein EVA89_01505 [Sandaracinaceae bacterium]HBQ12068.1 hypothetical protein [Myxococcales bacterium]
MRRGSALAIASVVLFVTAGAFVRLARPAPPRVRAGLTKGAPKDVTPAWFGHWIWSAAIEGDEMVTRITPSDLVTKVGPTGWPGCPPGIVCTRHGVRSLVFGEDGTFLYAAHPWTSSDFQQRGSWIDGAVQVDSSFSCAHPRWRAPPTPLTPVHAERRGARLWVAIGHDEDAPLPFAPRPTGRWWVFRRVSRSRFAALFPRLCQPEPSASCHWLCFAPLP